MGNQFKTTALLALLSAILITISYLIIGGTSGLIVGIAIAAVTNLVSWYQSDKLALAAYGAQPLSEAEAPGLYRMVETLASRANLPIPRVYIVNSATQACLCYRARPQTCCSSCHRRNSKHLD